MPIRRQPDRAYWPDANPYGVPVPEGEDRRLSASQLRRGDQVLLGRWWRTAASVETHTGRVHTWVHVHWVTPAGSRTVYHSAALVPVYRAPVMSLAGPEPDDSEHMYADDSQVWQS
ncbi:hypothetical protein [Streptomyces sp. NPDC058872]|uniref:hypothetical protein n=1 Tax=Streptomyces sp. NPDC058872 TaxID=3346661 RepID=UPI0036903C80